MESQLILSGVFKDMTIETAFYPARSCIIQEHIKTRIYLAAFIFSRAPWLILIASMGC